MTFEGQYLTKAEYEQLSGSQIDQMSFNLLEFEARRRIDVSTYDRLKKADTIPQEVKLCEYNLINCMKQFEQTTESVNVNGNVANESTDGYSIGYITADRLSEVIKSKESELDEIIRTYLLGVVVNKEHLLYCGVK